MQFDFSGVPDIHHFHSIPAGEYPVRIAEVREGTTRDGSPRWAFRLEVTDGEYAGRTAAWDALVWSQRALPRVKHVLSRLGFDVEGTLDISPEDLLGRVAVAQLVLEEREDPESGQRIARLRVPYMGYQRAPAPEETPF